MLARHRDATVTDTERKTIPATATGTERPHRHQERARRRNHTVKGNVSFSPAFGLRFGEYSFEVFDDLNPILASGKPMANDLLR